MKLSGFKSDLRSSHCFSTVLLSSWLLFAIAGPVCTDVAVQVRVTFSLIAALTTIFFLRELGYFYSLRPRPRKGDITIVALVSCLATFALYELFDYVFDFSICSEVRIVLASFVIGIISYAADFCYGSTFKNLKKRKIVLDVLPAEREQIIADITENNYAKNLEFLTCNDLRRAFLNGTAHEISLIVISRTAVGNFDVDGVLVRAHLEGIPVVDFQNLEADITGRVRLDHTDQWAFILEATKQTTLLKGYRRAKILLEPIIAVIMLLLLSPVFLVIAFLIKRSSPGPVFYKQLRTGYLGKPFTLIKFRSMRTDAEANGPQWSLGNDDARVTRIGAILRRNKLDELPQLINVIRCEMSFFGPRPERPEMYAKLKNDIPLFKMRTLVRPGISGWAQVCAGYASTVEQSKTKLEFDLYYIKRMTPYLDIVILVKTFLVAILGDKRSHYSETHSEGEVLKLEIESI